MRWTVCIAFLVSTLATTAASAHWQYTKWGMSPEEVVSAAEGRVRLSAGAPDQQVKGLKIGAEGSYSVGSLNLPATFYFDAKGLQVVDLKAENEATCRALDSRLRGEYGVPFASESSFFVKLVWKDQERGNRLEYLQAGDACWLKYTPLATPASSDL